MATLGERSSPRRERLNKQTGEQMNSLLASAFFQVHVGVTGMTSENLAMLRGMEQAGLISPNAESQGGVERKAEKVSFKAEQEDKFDLVGDVSIAPKQEPEATEVPEERKVEEPKAKTWKDRSIEIASELYPNATKETIELVSQDIRDKSNELASMSDEQYQAHRSENEDWGNPVYEDHIRSERLKFIESEKQYVREELSKPSSQAPQDDSLFGPPRQLTKEEKVWDSKLDFLANRKILSESRPEDFLRYSQNPDELRYRKTELKSAFDFAAKDPNVKPLSLAEKDREDVRKLYEKFGPGKQSDNDQDKQPKEPKQLSPQQEKIREARLNLHNQFMEKRQQQAAMMAAQWNPDMGSGWGGAFMGQIEPGQALPESMTKFAKESADGHEAAANLLTELARRVRMTTQMIEEAAS